MSSLGIINPKDIKNAVRKFYWRRKPFYNDQTYSALSSEMGHTYMRLHYDLTGWRPWVVKHGVIGLD